MKAHFDFDIPKELEEAINALEERENKGLTSDCEAEEVRMIAHCYLDKEQSDKVIDYYYRNIRK